MNLITYKYAHLFPVFVPSLKLFCLMEIQVPIKHCFQSLIGVTEQIAAVIFITLQEFPRMLLGLLRKRA